MSDQYRYICEKCGFSLWTDETGCGCTMCGISHLCLCDKCHTLVQRWEELCHDETGISWRNPHWWIPGEGTSIEDDGTCPICNSHNSLQKWNPTDFCCPKCGDAMLRDDSAGILHTD